MKQYAYILFALILLFTSCEPASYDDSGVLSRLDELEEQVSELEGRIEELETACNKATEDIAALRAIIEVLQSRDYVTSVTPIMDGDKVIGYTITFANSAPLTIYTCNCEDDDESIIVAITEGETEVVITLSDGSKITIPKGSAPLPTDYCEKLEDVEFMRYCYEKFDINGDKILSESEAKAIRAVNIDSKQNIYSVKGIEYFVNLESFQAYNAIALRTLDFSKNTNLRTIKEQALYKCSGLSKFTARRLPHRHWNNTPLRQPLMGVKSLFRKARSMRTKRLGATLPTRFTESRDYRTALIPKISYLHFGTPTITTRGLKDNRADRLQSFSSSKHPISPSQQLL